MVTDARGRGGHELDRVKPVFDDQRMVANAGVLLVATLVDRLGLEALIDVGKPKPPHVLPVVSHSPAIHDSFR